mgnify:CR=1 FL=1
MSPHDPRAVTFRGSATISAVRWLKGLTHQWSVWWALVVLALVRLFSVWPFGAERLAENRPRKESRMRNLVRNIPVVYTRCVLETIWAGGAGVMGTHWAS